MTGRELNQILEHLKTQMLDKDVQSFSVELPRKCAACGHGHDAGNNMVYFAVTRTETSSIELE